MTFSVGQAQPTGSDVILQGLGQGVSQGLQQSLNEFHEEQKLRKSQNQFMQQGFPEDLARLAAVASKGGETHIIKELLEQRKRGFGSEIPQQMTEEAELENIVHEGNAGLTPAERIKIGSERYKTGLPKYQETSDKLRGLQRDKERLDILGKLNKSGKLPKLFGRLNVDKEGNLRFPFATSPEAQRYIKTLNEFSAGAKDTFGSRVTNFDLQQFMQRFPTLLNSEEGREQIAKQMEIVNQINSTYYRNLKKVFDRAGGVRKIDADIAEGLAEKMSEKEIENLVSKFDEISENVTEKSEGEQPKTATNPKTGQKLIFKGGKWQPVR